MTIREHLGHLVGLMIVAIFIAIGIVSSAVTVAHSQTNLVGAGSESQSGAAAGANSGSTAGAVITFDNSTPGTITQRVEGGRNDRITYAYEGTSKAKIRTVPDVYAPALAGGNPCQSSASGGGSVLGFGLSAGYAWSDEDCSVRWEVSLLGNMAKLSGQDYSLAYRHFCLHSSRVRETFEAEGVIDCDVTPTQVAAAPVALCADGRPPSPAGYCPGDDISAKGKAADPIALAAVAIPAAPAAQPAVAKCDRLVDGKWCFVD